MLSQSHHLARTSAAATAARYNARPGRRLARTRVAAAVAAVALLASACSTEEPPAPPVGGETTTTVTTVAAADTSTPAVTAAPAVTSPCTDPDAMDLGEGLVELDGVVYEVYADACVPRLEEPAGGEEDTPTQDTPTTTTAAEPVEAGSEPIPEPIPEQMLAEGTVPEGENFVVIEVLQSENEPTGDEQIEDTPAPTTTAPEPDTPAPTTTAPEPDTPAPTTTTAPEPDTPAPTTTTAPEPDTPAPTTTAPTATPTTTTAPAAEPEPEDDEGDDPSSSVAATIHRPDYCELFDGTWNPSTSQCEAWTRVIQPLPEPVGDPVTPVTDEDDHFVSGSGRRVVRTEPAAIQVGSCLHNVHTQGIECPIIVTEIEYLDSGWWQVVVCTIHESFVLPEIGNEGWQGVAYAWQEDDGRFRIEQGNWRPGDDGPC